MIEFSDFEQRMLAKIQESKYLTVSTYNSRCYGELQVGDVVLIGPSCRNLFLARVKKIDKRGVITVESNAPAVRFSSRFGFSSTQKIDNVFWHIYHLQSTYDRACHNERERERAILRENKFDLQNLVAGLCAEFDREMIDRVRLMLEEYKSQKEQGSQYPAPQAEGRA